MPMPMQQVQDAAVKDMAGTSSPSSSWAKDMAGNWIFFGRNCRNFIRHVVRGKPEEDLAGSLIN